MERKTCARCRQIIPLSGFGPKESSKDGLQRLCKSCNSEQAKDYYHRKRLSHVYGERASKRKSIIKDVLASIKKEATCYFCGESEPVALDFHHLDQESKDIMVSKQGVGVKKLLKEIPKCEVVCATCHRKVHAEILDIKSRRNYSIKPLTDYIGSIRLGKQSRI